MDGILALGHFCETHGPCVILCTQRCIGPPKKQGPHILTTPLCEACQSINPDQTLISKDDKYCYATTRTPLQQDVAFLLKQATVRSLSCEGDTDGESSPLYFGDQERGHILSHTFTLQDSLARGFHRKYTILMLMKDKIYLLNGWSVIVRHIKEIVRELKEAANNINGVEQEQRSQRAVREAQGSPSSTARSLSQLTGKPAIFGHLHMWFVFMLSYPLAEEKSIPRCQDNKIKPRVKELRLLLDEMGDEVFKTVMYHTLVGTKLVFDDVEIIDVFQSMLPDEWMAQNIKTCTLSKTNTWMIDSADKLPTKIPTLLTSILKSVSDKRLPNSVLELQLIGLVTSWLNIVRSLCWASRINLSLLHSVGVNNGDLQLLQFWVSSYCKDLHKSQMIKDQLQKCLESKS